MRIAPAGFPASRLRTLPLARIDQTRLDQIPVSPANLADLYALSPMQAGMLFHSMYEPQGSAYVNQLRVDIEGLDVERFGGVAPGRKSCRVTTCCAAAS